MFTLRIPSQKSNWIRRALYLLAAVILALALLPIYASAAPLAKAKCNRTYEVKRGDTLAKIGSKYGKATNQIVYVNNWNSPYTIYVGQRICIPTETVSGLSKLASKYANAQAVYFTAGRAGNEILVYTYNYPNTTVEVKVDNAGDSIRKLITVDTFDIVDVGNRETVRLKLPTELRSASELFICLKDKTTNYLQCVYPRRGP